MNDPHLTNEALTTALRTWVKESPPGQPDRSRVVGNVVVRLGSTRRRRGRWWRASSFHRGAGKRSMREAPGYRVGPIPAADDHTPTIIGRTQSMLSPAKVITAGALVFAIGGVMLITQPLDRPSVVPGVATDDPAMAPSFFSGTTDDWNLTIEPVTVRRDDGVVDGTGESYTLSWNANDPRIAGTATMTMNETDYRVGASRLVPTGDMGTIRTLLLGVVNDGGTWEGPFTVLQLEGPPEVAYISGWLTGTDAYEGLSAYVVWSLTEGEDEPSYWGHITSEGPPPAPDGLPER